MSRSLCFSNNRGGVGKTFTTFQTCCAIAVSNPTKKVLAIDFSIYSELTCALLGGTASASPFEAPAGLRVCREKIPPEKRVEGLLLSLASKAPSAGATGGRGFLGGVFSRIASSDPKNIDLASYGVRASDFNDKIPSNVYLVASAGAESFAPDSSRPSTPPPWSAFDPDIGKRLARAVDDLPDEFVTVFFDTDHLAGGALARMALCASDLCAVPCPTDTAEFQRLYQTPDAKQFPGVESLFGDVMLPMHRDGHLRARVVKMIFTKVPSNHNKVTVTPGGIKLPFTPNAATVAQMDGLASLAWEVLDKHPEFRPLFLDGDKKDKREFVENTFAGFKLIPDLAKNISMQNGVPICSMTPQTYTTVAGVTGSTNAATLQALKGEIAALIA
jgi:cellulose biosynthesis protein BcsQ